MKRGRYVIFTFIIGGLPERHMVGIAGSGSRGVANGTPDLYTPYSALYVQYATLVPYRAF